MSETELQFFCAISKSILGLSNYLHHLIQYHQMLFIFFFSLFHAFLLTLSIYGSVLNVCRENIFYKSHSSIALSWIRI